MHLRLARYIGLIAVAAFAACAGDGFTPSAPDLVGTYTATAFTTTNGDMVIDQLAAGASLTITLEPDGTTSGRLTPPGGNTDGAADLAGRWAFTGSTVRFTQAAVTFVRDMPFAPGQSRLHGQGTFHGITVQVTLSR